MAALSIVAVSGNVRRPSRTATVVARLAEAAARRTGGKVRLIELVDAAPVLFAALQQDQLSPEGADIVAAVEGADLLVVGSPVYRASYTGALKHLFDLVGYRALVGKPVLLAATGGSPLHGLAIDHQLRPLFAFFQALTLPTSIYATEADFERHDLTNVEIAARIEQAAEQAAAVIRRNPAIPAAA